MNPIVLATDGSSTATAAAEIAIDLAGATNAPLVVVVVWDVPYTGIGYAPVPAVLDVNGTQAKRAFEVADGVAEQARRAGVEVESAVRRGFPVDEICRVAEERRARLLVVGSHGWGRFRRMLLGSVSAAVLHSAPCPVLVPARTDSENSGAARTRVQLEV